MSSIRCEAADLRFSLDEAEIFIQKAISTPLSDEVFKRLVDRTEGWIAGLHLATLALQHRENETEVQQFLDTFTGSLRPIQEYLVQEVFGAQPENIQDFLLRTSLLGRLTGSLCDEVTGRDDSSILLDQLERDNLFLMPLMRLVSLLPPYFELQQYTAAGGSLQELPRQPGTDAWSAPEAVEAALARYPRRLSLSAHYHRMR
jgi:hypothetical protein